MSAPRPPETTRRLLDWAALDLLVTVGGEEFAAEVAAIFLRDTPLRVDAARAAFGARDLEEVRRAAHALFGGARQIGADAFAAVAREAELCAARGDADALGPLVESLVTMSAPLLTELAAWHATLSAARTSSS